MSTFWRLLGFLKPYRAGAVWSLILAALAMVATVAIPWLTGKAIDGLDAGEKADLRRYALLIALVGVLCDCVRALAREIDNLPGRQ